MYYLDSAYLAKRYLNDSDSEPVRDFVRTPAPLYSSVLCIAEVVCAMQRRYREGAISRRQVDELSSVFRKQVEDRVWTLIPVSESLLWEVHDAVRRLARSVFLRSADAIHLASARRAGFSEIWTNDRQMLEAARHFGLRGRSV